MADAKLTPRQLVDVLHRLDAIESNTKEVRAQLIQAMANRRPAGDGPAARRAAAARPAPPPDGGLKRRRD